MKFKVDENLPLEVAAMLRDAGHDAMTVLEQGLGGHVDASIADVCKREARALVTLDLDFSSVQRTRPRSTRASLCCGLEGRTKRTCSPCSRTSSPS